MSTDLPAIGIYAPSYRRPGQTTTQAMFPRCTYVVAESEAPAYEAAGARIWAVPDAAQGNLCRIRNYILDHAPEDLIVLLDDDFQHIGRICKSRPYFRDFPDPDSFYAFLENGFRIALDANVYLWGINPVADRLAYRVYTPFSTVSYIGGPFQAVRRETPLRYDENLPLKEDYDFTLQHLNHHRRVWRFNAYSYRVRQHEQAGGCAAYRTLQREHEQFQALRRKWGSRIVQLDPGLVPGEGRSRVLRGGYDINPVIRAPIKGV